MFALNCVIDSLDTLSYLLVHGILQDLLLLVQYQIQGSLLLLLRILFLLHKQHMLQLLRLVFPLLE